MKAKFKNKTVEVWKIEKTGNQPDWVKESFTKNEFSWDGNSLKVLISAFKPSTFKNFSGGFGSGGVRAIFGKIGDYIILEDGKIVTAKKFAKDYEIQI